MNRECYKSEKECYNSAQECYKCERKKCNKCNNIRLYYQDNPKLLKPCSNEFCSNNN